MYKNLCNSVSTNNETTKKLQKKNRVVAPSNKKFFKKQCAKTSVIPSLQTMKPRTKPVEAFVEDHLDAHLKKLELDKRETEIQDTKQQAAVPETKEETTVGKKAGVGKRPSQIGLHNSAGFCCCFLFFCFFAFCFFFAFSRLVSLACRFSLCCCCWIAFSFFFLYRCCFCCLIYCCWTVILILLLCF